MNLKVCIIGGAGYVGLITGVGLAYLGHQVINVDIDEGRLAHLQAGNPVIYEDHLESALRQVLTEGKLRFSSNLQTSVAESDIIFIAVGTPAQDDGQADLSQVIEVSEDLAHFANAYKLIVVKSTVPVGTVELVRSILCRNKREGKDFDIASNPEFLREGKGLYDFFFPNRIVVGTLSSKARQWLYDLYAPLIGGEFKVPEGLENHPLRKHVPVVDTDTASAQMIKYASNAFLATRVSFINEIAGLCERVNADIKEVALGMGFDPRIGSSYLEAGLGFGGPCLEKDLKALIKIAEANGYEPRVLRSALDRNAQQLNDVMGKVKQLAGDLLYKKIITVFGLTFKSGTNDVRNSLSMRLIEQLEREGAIVHAHDPLGLEEARLLHPQAYYFEDPYEAAAHADALVVATDWPHFIELDFSRLKAMMASPSMVDARNLLHARGLRELGFRYLGIGIKV